MNSSRQFIAHSFLHKFAGRFVKVGSCRYHTTLSKIQKSIRSCSNDFARNLHVTSSKEVNIGHSNVVGYMEHKREPHDDDEVS